MATSTKMTNSSTTVWLGRHTISIALRPRPLAFLFLPGSWAAPDTQNVSSTFGVIKDITTRHNVYLDASYIANLFSQQHVFKFGYALARVGNDVNDDFANGQFDIYWGDSFSRGSITNAKGTYGYYIWQDGVRHNSIVNSRNQGFYLQDAWKIHPRITLNLGVRFENEFLPPYKKEVNGIKIANPVSFGWTDKIAPRLAAPGTSWRWKMEAQRELRHVL